MKMDNLKPIVLTVTPALGGNILGVLTPVESFPIIPFLQSMAYVVSILIGVFQLRKYFRETNLWGRVEGSLSRIKGRWMATNNRYLKVIGDFCVFVALPAVETMSFYQPELESKRLLFAGILIGIKGITNFSKEKPKY